MTVDTTAIRRSVEEMAVRLGDDLGDAFVEEARNNASKRTGELADSISHTPAVLAGSVVKVVASATSDHARYQEEGTGLYGPTGDYIRPTTAKVLVFDSPIYGIVYARKVRGSEPTRFWSRTVAEWPSIVRSL